ncbi:hypothetical protein BOX15_Mlig009815g1 [Macrostomum lignano]|uniref:Signal peptidase complex subunit 1 n=1 Tax=Macrostomum lignano TaxID=282301 RepID=A0A267GKY1_9PLAT|nr:hypothetical protein BOX15_Mlig009815g1 [Macrostomum lignano]
MKFLTDLTSRIPTHMDFEGQRRAERTFQFVLAIFGLAGLAWGYICQQFSQTVLILAAGFALSALLTLPPWPMYRRSQLRWQPVRPAAATGEAETGSKQQGRKQNKKDK